MELIIKEKNSICLNMIVKNESHIIIKTLENLTSKIQFSYWVISDTGSTDNTKELILDFFKERNIPGELVEHEWKDFGYNRSKALNCAFNKTDYLFIFDADDEIHGTPLFPEPLTGDKYNFKFGKTFTYTRPLLINNRIHWKYEGVLHECIENIDPITSCQNIEGDYFIESGKIGARSRDPDKYLKDAILLKNAFEEEIKKSNNSVLSCRYAFYCAQSYKDCKKMDDAIEWYTKCLNLNNWTQEKYYSCIQLGICYADKNMPYESIRFFLKSGEYDTERIEGIVYAMKILNKDKMYIMSNALYHKYKNYKNPLESKLFLNQQLYYDEMEYENSIAAFYSNNFEPGYLCCKQILINQIISFSLQVVTLQNLKFYSSYIEKDADCLLLFYGVDKLLVEMVNNNISLSNNHFLVWNKLFKKNRDKLMDIKTNMFIENKAKLCKRFLEINEFSRPKIILSFTTCKRLNLFIQTVASILNHWLDLDKIDYWFCVDDNSTEEDRDFMRSNFNWIDYYMKDANEKGHRKSMNIIWSKLSVLKPTYWIHMEDDFLFYNKMNYIEEGIKGLNLLKDDNVKQIVFNLNYGETVENYYNKSNINKNNGFSVHDYKEGQFNYINCHYWPHYSFRPSIVEVTPILELGNYNTDNTFFEMDYAKRWANAGYKTGFFNKITARHIGRLTSERNDVNNENAYTLNNESQFCTPLHAQSEKRCNINNNEFIKIVNLEKRIDRKEKTNSILQCEGFVDTDYEFIKAINGYDLVPTQELQKLFKGNDFNSRKGVIGCALTHYKLWKRLVEDMENDFYLILEDDITLPKNSRNLFPLNYDLKEKDCVFLGYHMFEKKRNEYLNLYGASQLELNDNDVLVKLEPLNKKLYVGGTFAYSINKKGAEKMLKYIEKNGIKRGIDIVMKMCDTLNAFEVQPQLIFSVWNEDGKHIDTDIQNNYDSLDFSLVDEDTFSQDLLNDFIFLVGFDQINNDLYRHTKKKLKECFEIAFNDKDCVGFNTLGFFKSELTELSPSVYFKNNDGLWVKKTVYNMYLANKKITI